jgi:hypothetical protein
MCYVVHSVASFVVCGVIRSTGPGLLCLLVATVVFYSVYVYKGRCVYILSPGICRTDVPLFQLMHHVVFLYLFIKSVNNTT